MNDRPLFKDEDAQERLFAAEHLPDETPGKVASEIEAHGSLDEAAERGHGRAFEAVALAGSATSLAGLSAAGTEGIASSVAQAELAIILGGGHVE
jgi:hypothetical protein